MAEHDGDRNNVLDFAEWVELLSADPWTEIVAVLWPGLKLSFLSGEVDNPDEDEDCAFAAATLRRGGV